MHEDLSQILSHLYRNHFGKMVAVLMYHTGIGEMAVAEDIVQEAFAIASDKWQKTIPDAPEAWLYATVRNIAYNALKKDRRNQILEDDFTSSNLIPANDQDLLRVLFGCLQPTFPPKVQLVIVLRYVCGLRVKRIAALLASNEDNISKIIYRWRAQIKPEDFVVGEVSDKTSEQKIRMALKILYVMFTEGYQLSSDGNLLEETLCEDALSFLQELMQTGIVANGDVKALYALLLYNLARAGSRTNQLEGLTILAEQDRNGWNKKMIAVANRYFLLAQKESCKVSSYQLEAAIAFKHTQAPCYEETDWHGIAKLYQQLVRVNSSPFTKLGQAAALYFGGDIAASMEILTLLNANPFFRNYHLIHCFWAKIYSDENDVANAIMSYKKALACPVNAFEKKFIQNKLQLLT